MKLTLVFKVRSLNTLSYTFIKNKESYLEIPGTKILPKHFHESHISECEVVAGFSIFYI